MAADAINRLNDIGAGLTEDNNCDGRLSVKVAAIANILCGIDNLRYVRETDCGAILVTDDQRRIFGGVIELPIDDDVRRCRLVCDLTTSQIGVLRAQNRLHVREC